MFLNLGLGKNIKQWILYNRQIEMRRKRKMTGGRCS